MALNPKQLQAARLAGNPRVVSQQDNRPPPTLRVNERFNAAFPEQGQNIEEFNQEMSRWWADFMAHQTKE